MYSIFGQLKSEIEDFDTKGVYIVGKPESEIEFRGSRGSKGGYFFSQKEVLESIDLACASKFKQGIRDDENQRKTYLNIVNFYRDVTKMKIIVRVANYIFEPKSLDFFWPVWMMGREFKTWASEESYDDQIDEMAEDLSTYGSCVVKKLKDCTELVPLRTLRVTQTAKSLDSAAQNGGYVIVENEMHYNQMSAYKGWNTDDLDKNKSYHVFERYGLAPTDLIENWNNADFDPGTLDENTEMKLCVAILLPKEGPSENHGQKILFMEKLPNLDEVFDECHMQKVHGRWLGRGEVEKQLENQISRNLTANLRRRSMLWATKKLYQSTDDEVQSNLLMEVRDGDVINIKNGGNITPVNTQTQHLGDFTADEASWDENSQRISFAFDSATGESMPSGTSFSLGVILQKAVADHFDLVKHKFANFLKRSYFNQLVPIFQQENSSAHTLMIGMSESDIDNLKQSIITWHTNERIWNSLMSDGRPDADTIQQQVTIELGKSPYAGIDLEADFYTNIEYYMNLNIDDDIGPDVQTLTTIWQSLNQKQDPRADTVLNMILAKQGKSLDQIAGTSQVKPIPPVAAPAPQTSAAPDVNITNQLPAQPVPVGGGSGY